MFKIALALGTAVALSACTTGPRNQTATISYTGGGNIAPRYNARHYRWCARRKNYRRYDNTFQQGSFRRRCVSPYI